MKEKTEPKVPVTIRLAPENLERLKKLAGESKGTVSSYIDEAVEEYLNRRGAGIPTTSLQVSSLELTKAASVVEAIGKSIPFHLLILIMEEQKKE